MRSWKVRMALMLATMAMMMAVAVPAFAQSEGDIADAIEAETGFEVDDVDIECFEEDDDGDGFFGEDGDSDGEDDDFDGLFDEDEVECVAVVEFEEIEAEDLFF